MVYQTLANGCRAAELLIEQYGADNIRQVEQRSPNIFQALMQDGRMAAAIVRGDGTVTIRALDEL